MWNDTLDLAGEEEDVPHSCWELPVHPWQQAWESILWLQGEYLG